MVSKAVSLRRRRLSWVEKGMVGGCGVMVVVACASLGLWRGGANGNMKGSEGE